MSDQPSDALSPGQMLRAARESQGIHIAAMAAAIKVSARKLDALEHDRWDELPDATFIRALAQTVCRTLKIDASPVLALLPRAGAVALQPASGGLNAPFRDRPGRDEVGLGIGLGPFRPMATAAVVFMMAAVAVYFLPDSVWSGALFKSAPPAAKAEVPPVVASASEPASAAAASEPGASASASGVSVADALPNPVTVAAPSSTAAASSTIAAVVAPAPPKSTLRLRTSDVSWIEVRDAVGKVLLSRLVQAGESLDLDGTLPLRLTIGNALATRVDFLGLPVNLAPSTRDNVVRVELK